MGKFPFEKNIFIMMRFRKENKTLSDFIIRTLSDAGLKGIRADQPEWNLTNNVYNPIAVLYCCKYGIALFDKGEENQAYNPNVIYELGIMHNLGRECLILRNDSLPAVPFDLIKDLYMPYRGELAVRTNIQRWLQRIAPGGTEATLPTRLTRKARLEYAAVAAPPDNTDSIIASPDNIVANEFMWQVLSREKKSWKISWSVNLTNESRDAIDVKVQVLFLDKNGFALDDHVGPLSQNLPPHKSRLYKAITAMSPDLANRIQHAMATVLTSR